MTNVDRETVEPCNHEEADSRVLLHCFNIAQTDVVVIAVSQFNKLSIQQLWIHFGVGKAVRLMPIHDLVAALGPGKCEALRIFHAMTGCDTVSCFHGREKKSVWSAWESYPAVTQAFRGLMLTSPVIEKVTLELLERFVN
jgi:hypothetical protein